MAQPLLLPPCFRLRDAATLIGCGAVPGAVISNSDLLLPYWWKTIFLLHPVLAFHTSWAPICILALPLLLLIPSWQAGVGCWAVLCSW